MLLTFPQKLSLNFLCMRGVSLVSGLALQNITRRTARLGHLDTYRRMHKRIVLFSRATIRQRQQDVVGAIPSGFEDTTQPGTSLPLFTLFGGTASTCQEPHPIAHLT